MNNDSIKILLIEDDKVDGMFFQRALSKTAINSALTIMEDAVSGISKFREEDFDCVFLDYMLPGTDGLEVLKQLREDVTSSIVLITSHGDEKIAVEAMKAGALDYISKGSITPESLEKIIRNVMRFRDSEKEKIAIEEAFRKGEKRYRIFFEKSQGFFCTHDIDGNFITVNHAGAQSISYTPEELIGANIKKLLSSDTHHFFDKYLEHILREKSAKGLMKILTKDGEERIWSYNNSLYEEPNETYVIASIQDITDRVKIEEEKANSRRIAEESERIKKLMNEVNLYSNKLKDSINYAKRLQDGIYSGIQTFKQVFPDSFVINYPKEIVSGDFYWFTRKNGKLILALADCTGHGVPGALLSTLGYTMLNNISLNNNFTSPGKIIKKLREEWRTTFDNINKKNNNYDGMEIAVCAIDYEKRILEFSGMGGSIFITKKGELFEYRGANNSISYNYYLPPDGNSDDTITQQIFFEEDDCIYLFSDGYRDQFGGPSKNEKFTKRRFKDLITGIQKSSMETQKKMMEDAFMEWKGNNAQTDDILLIGVKL